MQTDSYYTFWCYKENSLPSITALIRRQLMLLHPLHKLSVVCCAAPLAEVSSGDFLQLKSKLKPGTGEFRCSFIRGLLSLGGEMHSGCLSCFVMHFMFPGIFPDSVLFYSSPGCLFFVKELKGQEGTIEYLLNKAFSLSIYISFPFKFYALKTYTAGVPPEHGTHYISLQALASSQLQTLAAYTFQKQTN